MIPRRATVRDPFAFARVVVGFAIRTAATRRMVRRKVTHRIHGRWEYELTSV